MSIKDLIKQLEEKSNQIEFLDDLKSSLSSFKSDKIGRDAQKSLLSELSTFIDSQKSKIEQSALGSSSPAPVESSKPTPPKSIRMPDTPKIEEEIKKDLSKTDKIVQINWAKERMHLAGKKVKLGEEKLVGEVVGFNMPYIVIELEDSKRRVKVSESDLEF